MRTACVLLFPLALALVGAFQARVYRDRLAAHVLRSGRIVLAPGQFQYHADDPDAAGKAERVLDGNPDQAALVAFPGPHPEGTWFLIDLALTHWPGSPPRARQPAFLEIYSGPCTRCARPEFERYARPRRVRLQLLYRRANRPDEEFIIPQAAPVWERRLVLRDAPGPQRVEFDAGVPRTPASAGWPENMQYIVLKLIVEDVYPGRRFTDRLALGEVIYADRDAHRSGPVFRWE